MYWLFCLKGGGGPLQHEGQRRGCDERGTGVVALPGGAHPDWGGARRRRAKSCPTVRVRMLARTAARTCTVLFGVVVEHVGYGVAVPPAMWVSSWTPAEGCVSWRASGREAPAPRVLPPASCNERALVRATRCAFRCHCDMWHRVAAIWPAPLFKHERVVRCIKGRKLSKHASM